MKPALATRSRYEFAIIDPLGKHGGFHYFTHGTACGMAEAGHSVAVYVTKFTGSAANVPYKSHVVFGDIYGTDPLIVRAGRYFAGLSRALWSARRHGATTVFLHSFHSDLRELAAIAGARFFGMKTVVTCHDIETFGHARMSWIKRLCIRNASALVFLNRFSQREFTRLNGFSKAPNAIIPHGHYIDAYPDPIGRTAARHLLDLPLESKLMLFFGNPREEKGLDLLLAALTDLRDLPDWALVVAGKMKPSYQQVFLSQAAKAGLEGRIHWDPNFIPDDKAAAYYCAADLVVLPYRRVYESGVAIMSMSFSRAIVASDLEPFKDLVGADPHGFLFQAQDVKDLSVTLRKALADSDALDAIGARGYQSMLRMRNWTLIGAQLSDLAKSLLGDDKTKQGS